MRFLPSKYLKISLSPQSRSAFSSALISLLWRSPSPSHEKIIQIVVHFIENNKPVVTYDLTGNYETATTLKHIKSFLRQKGFKADSKKQILEDYKPEPKPEPENKEPIKKYNFIIGNALTGEAIGFDKKWDEIESRVTELKKKSR